MMLTLLKPKQTVESVAHRLADGLRDGSVTLSNNAGADAELTNQQRARAVELALRFWRRFNIASTIWLALAMAAVVLLSRYRPAILLEVCVVAACLALDASLRLVSFVRLRQLMRNPAPDLHKK